MKVSEGIRLKVEFTREYKGRVYVNEATGDPETEWMLLDCHEGNLADAKVRSRIIEAVVSKHSAPGDAKAAAKLVEDKILQAIEDRQKIVSSKLIAAPSKGTFKPLPEVALDTDLQNAHRFCYRYGTYMRWCQAWGKWLVWDGRRWSTDERQTVYGWAMDTARAIYDEIKVLPVEQQKSLGKHARDSQNRSRIESVIALCKALVPVTPQELDTHSHLLVVENGVINLANSEWMGHHPPLLITKCAPVVYNPAATCPVFERFVHQIMDGRFDLIDYLQRLMGMCLTGDIGYQAMPIFHGEGANGKSTLLDTMLAILGEYAALAPESLLMSRQNDEHATELADLQGRRLVVASETNEGKKLNVARVKSLTGDSTITARRMRCDFYSFTRTHKTIMMTNNRPRISEDSEGIWRRLKLIPFSVTIPPDQRDPNLLAKVKSEASGILNWLLAGCIKWRHSGMNEPAIVSEATTEYRTEEDPLKDFLTSRCILGDDVRVTNPDLWREYTQWATLAGNKYPLGNRGFLDRVTRIAGVKKDRFIVGGVQHRGFVGIGLRAEVRTAAGGILDPGGNKVPEF